MQWVSLQMLLFQSHLSRYFSCPVRFHASAFFSSVSALRESNRSEAKGLENALKLLGLIHPKSETKGCENNLRLLQGCLEELLEASPEQQFKYTRNVSRRKVISTSDGKAGCSISGRWMEGSKCQYTRLWRDPMLSFFEMHSEGMKADPTVLSSVLSSCGALESLEPGIQLHSLAVKSGLDAHVSVGTSLVSLYCKCQRLDDAYVMFDKMPVRNSVSWTAIISGFAQQWEVEMCLELFYLMRASMFRPTDVTFSSLLSVCTCNSYLGRGRSTHCQVVRMGFDSHVHVSNSLASMYAKCGSIDDALYVFESMAHKDIISWNTMIAGFAQHGLASHALKLFDEMKEQKIAPDAITFLCLLSSCRHAGLLEQGRMCFDSMLAYGVRPELDHYSCMVDLLGRAGLLQEAYEFILKMPILPNSIIWGSLLSSCNLHRNVSFGIRAAESRLLFEPACAAAHVQLANLYAGAGRWDHVAEVRKLMNEKGLKPSTGYSWIEIGNTVHRFRAEYRSDAEVIEIFTVVDGLLAHMKSIRYVPEMSTNLLEDHH